MHRLVPLSVTLALAMSGCSSTSSQQSELPASSSNDASACDGVACGAEDGDASEANDAGSMAPRPNLCPQNGRVGLPLPTDVGIAYELQQGSDTIGDLLVNDSVLVWKNQRKVARVNLDDGAVTILVDHSASLDDRVDSIALDGTYVYFSDAVDPRYSTPSLGIARYPLKGGGSPTTVLNDPTAGLLAISDGYIYYEHRNVHGTFQSDIARVPTTGGTPTTLVRGVINGVRGLAVGGGYVYFLGTIGGASYSSYYLARVAITAQAPDLPDGGLADDAGASTDAGVQPDGADLVATTGFRVSGPVTDSTNVYWGSDDKLMARPLAGGSPTILAQADPITGPLTTTADVYGIVAHGDSVYWSSSGCEAIRKSPTAGGPATAVVPGVSAAAMGVNSTHVYFAPTATQILAGPL